MSLEICIDSLESARAAVEGGADRLEVCSSLSLGGLTPSYGLMRKISEELDTVAYCMLRTRPGDFVVSKDEFVVLLADCDALKQAGAKGFVFGFLTREGRVDRVACADLLKIADRPCTFHRAFDHSNDWNLAFEDIVQLGFQTILTSGQKPTALEGLPVLKELLATNKGRIDIMAGSGVNAKTLPQLLESLEGLRWVHGSASVEISVDLPSPPFSMGPFDSANRRITSAQEVRSMKKALGWRE